MSHRWTELSFLRTFSNSDCLLSVSVLATNYLPSLFLISFRSGFLPLSFLLHFFFVFFLLCSLRLWLMKHRLQMGTHLITGTWYKLMKSCPNNLVKMRYHIKVLKWWLAMCQRNLLHCLLLLYNSMDYTFRTLFHPRTHKIIAEQAKYSITNSYVYATSTSPLEYQ